MAGGTGGHVFPGLAVAHRMQAAGWRVLWLGSATGMEAKLVAQHGIPIEFVRFGGLRGKGLRTQLMLPANLARACADSVRVLRRVRPDVVLGMGGYITFPAGLMTVLARRALVLHEQNSVAGLANRVLAKLASRVLVAFPGALPHAEWTGNPIRDAVIDVAPPAQRYARRSGPLRLLVVGGSLGAAALNEVVPRALAALPPAQRPHVFHQAGAKHLDALRANYAAAGLWTNKDAGTPGARINGAPVAGRPESTGSTPSVELVPFIDDMASAYAQADVVICRAGAMTVAEIAAIGVAALFVPFPFAVDDHQTSNAAFLADQGAAEVIQQRDLDTGRLTAWLARLDRDTLAAMAGKARALAKPDATDRVAAVCAAAAAASRKSA
ncbi:UDP-N-acetylglucosamine--N-acetylmuramyl-(pentapeptide) pyrophosphoryl-undecaprenol N-acetylglucosamine transferase [Robbsia sp. Bb-Pol-6]|uniref:UDP-N-acetylglucosamine--N-acetylmuramyl-(pentapeptide) pyrophosphoryl-undecaprenol N-acetylglucosamine transferase n=2 Tax=Robbsia betulipollinis TaxID=2981849 RepID=A0ABT3ZQY6_9BURK|nr:UDP-N-acetylglucosamine--N-acetylmuramyl-(pentapeptide) pyrophosphoryl-undecaprenol N-acetylglucosamine transferase [Robbsia betulipollinis]MCY0388946.1 UDP-N-acetylglucosamine--N-acetylmuramyl-(pentapeptide) pyrophosphoryl-undecaprenol N-acetylglucosamine transferase [Robbsia betulipollinis]